MLDSKNVAKRFPRSKNFLVLQAKLGATIKHFRPRLGFTQEELAWRSDMRRTYIADIERGGRNITLRSIAQLALALRVFVEALLSQAEAAADAGKPGKIAARAGVMGEVLLVEDDPSDVELTLRAFWRAKFANPMRVARDGDEALAYLFCTGDYSGRVGAPLPQLILLDLMLPKVSGLDVLRRIKADPQLKAIPVVVLSGSHEDENIVECARLGAENYIIKPVLFENFCKVTSRLHLQWALLKSSESDASLSE